MVIFVAKLMEVLHLHAKPVNKIKPLDSRYYTIIYYRYLAICLKDTMGE